MDSEFLVVAGMFGLVLIVVLLCVYWLRSSFLKWFAVSTGIIVFVSWLAGFLYARVGRVMLIPNTLVLSGVYIAILQIFVRYVRRYINEISGGLQQVAQGNLRYRSKDKLRSIKNEFGSVVRSIDDMVSIVKEPVQGIEATCEQVESSSEQFQRQSEVIAQGANNQAASAEEISSAMAQMGASIKQNMDNAKEGAVVSGQVEQEMHGVQEAFEKTSGSMHTIQERVAVVADIANKTNILAINAAIEAARAGELGRGFAVVAGEVRRLADMSAKAAQEIQDLSTNSTEAVEQMGNTLRTMLPGVQRIAGVVREISVASDEQNAGISQVNTALAQLAQVTSTNASSADELNAMAVKLVNNATDLRGAVSRFSL